MSIDLSAEDGHRYTDPLGRSQELRRVAARECAAGGNLRQPFVLGLERFRRCLHPAVQRPGVHVHTVRRFFGGEFLSLIPLIV